MEFEDEFFGTTIQRSKQMPKYCSFAPAVAQVKATQWKRYGWNPAAPRTQIAMEIFNAVRKNLPERSRKWLQLYCAIDTPLDWYYGTDMFFTLHFPGIRRDSIVTVDITLKQEKELTKLNPDIYLSKRHLEDRGQLEIVGAYIASLLLERIGLPK